MNLEIVEASLRGKALDFDTKIGERPLFELISNGTLVNTVTSLTNKKIPTLSIFRLVSWREKNKEFSISGILSNIIFYKNEVGDDSGKPFEKIHSNWEILFRLLNPGEIPYFKLLLQQQDYFYDENQSLIESRAKFIPQTQLERMKELNKLKMKVTGKTYFCSEEKVDKFTKKECLERIVHFSKPNQPALDMTIFEEDEKNEMYAFLIQSKIIAKSSLNYNNLPPKESAIEEFKKLFTQIDIVYNEKAKNQKQETLKNQFSIKKENIFFVVVAWRKISEENLKKLYQEKNVDVVYAKEELECLYSPSLKDLDVLIQNDEKIPKKQGKKKNFPSRQK